MAKREGTVIQIVGPVLDIRFADDCLPELMSAIEIPHGEGKIVAAFGWNMRIICVATVVILKATGRRLKGLCLIVMSGA